MERIEFCLEGDSEKTEFYVLEQTKLGGCDYILVTDAKEDEDGEAMILKDISDPEDPEAIYETVVDDTELEAVCAIFSDLLEDVELER